MKFQRFVSQDPIGLAGGSLNLYGYALSNPVSLRDPSGLDVSCVQLQTGGTFCVNNDDPGDTRSDPDSFSGNGPGLNNPLLEGAQGVGPLPHGIYDMDPDTDRCQSVGADPIGLEPHGPLPGNRGGFCMHGNQRPDRPHNHPPSNGCPVVKPSLRQWIIGNGGGTLFVPQGQL
jgi:hypothetical protein